MVTTVVCRRGAPDRACASALRRLRDAPLDLLSESGSESLDGRELRVNLAGFEAGDSGLRGAHPGRDDRLREDELLATLRQFAQELASPQGGVDEFRELGVAPAALADDLGEEIVTGHG